MPSRDRNVGAPGQDVPGVSPHPLSGDSPDREAGEFLERLPAPQRHLLLCSLLTLPCSWSPVVLRNHPPLLTCFTAVLSGSSLYPGAA